MKLILSAICGALSVLLVFFAVPLLFSVPPFLGLPDFIWMLLRVLLPVAIAVAMLRRISPGFVWVGLPVQYFAVFVFKEQISDCLGISLNGMGSIEYLFEAAFWPFAVTLLQFIVLALHRKLKKEN